MHNQIWTQVSMMPYGILGLIQYKDTILPAYESHYKDKHDKTVSWCHISEMSIPHLE